ncbi:Protein CBG27407 [Caenorhabditis briggsae]|nr:Protein CBG27407 [Caenorhabditis briggsae]CAS00214.1 Protein CBG27407 [Caenorhabditis briggsae]
MSRKRRNQEPEKIEKKKAIAIEQADRVERRNLYWSPRFILYRWIFLTLTFIQLGLLIKALIRKYITGAG